MDYIWEHGEWTYASTADTPAEFTMRNEGGERMQLNRLERSEPEHTLGVKLAPNRMKTKVAEDGKTLSEQDTYRAPCMAQLANIDH